MFHSLLYDLSDVKNVGMIIRSHAAFGGGKVFVFNSENTIINPKRLKSTSRSMNEKVDLNFIEDIEIAFDFAHQNKIRIVAIEIDEDAVSLHSSTLEGDILFVLGSELSGVPNEILDRCDQIISVPQYGKIGSLNVSQAASIAMYEYMRSSGVEPNKIAGSRYELK